MTKRSEEAWRLPPPGRLEWKSGVRGIVLDEPEQQTYEEPEHRLDLEEWLDAARRVYFSSGVMSLKPALIGYIGEHGHGTSALRHLTRLAAEVTELKIRARQQEDINTVLYEAIEELRNVTQQKASGMALPAQTAQPLVRQLPPAPIGDTRRLRELFLIETDDALKARIGERPELHSKLIAAASQIERLFADGRPMLSVDADGRIVVRVPTKLDAEQAAEPLAELRALWRKLFATADRVTPGLTFI